ncbi:BQ5605_C001g00822 [Microbotryum silenes-dioicae]|uniref:BQ5605_C001g00822 protein n=1 Tax=Microbotryum silenes-dioicae TaxID=796604 RepID=A0A2X0MRW0_9BASI|nr:BQ5605_C001g00822 [Microbotryum silenes-dioicae]
MVHHCIGLPSSPRAKNQKSCLIARARTSFFGWLNGPADLEVFTLPEQQWNAWWKALRKLRRVHSDAEDTVHLLSPGSLHPGRQLASSTSPHSNNRSSSCGPPRGRLPFCPSSLVCCPRLHTPSVIRIWSYGLSRPSSDYRSYDEHFCDTVFVNFVCPAVSRSERRLVELRVLFFHSIWKLCRRRRFSSDLLEPIIEMDFEGLRASIQESKGRLVSL